VANLLVQCQFQQAQDKFPQGLLLSADIGISLFLLEILTLERMEAR
jgi:hypothetical protein